MKPSDFLKLVPDYEPRTHSVEPVDGLLGLRRERLAKAGFPAKCLAIREPRQTQALSLLRSAILSGPGIYVMAGGTGTGKSTAATTAGLERLGSVWYRTARDFAKESRYKKQAWLDSTYGVLDDLGTEYLDKSGSTLADIGDIVDHYDRQLKTLVIATNLRVDKFRERYGGEYGRISSRIRGSGLFGWMTLSGGDMRASVS